MVSAASPSTAAATAARAREVGRERQVARSQHMDGVVGQHGESQRTRHRRTERNLQARKQAEAAAHEDRPKKREKEE